MVFICIFTRLRRKTKKTKKRMMEIRAMRKALVIVGFVTGTKEECTIMYKTSKSMQIEALLLHLTKQKIAILLLIALCKRTSWVNFFLFLSLPSLPFLFLPFPSLPFHWFDFMQITAFQINYSAWTLDPKYFLFYFFLMILLNVDSVLIDHLKWTPWFHGGIFNIIHINNWSPKPDFDILQLKR